MNARTWAISLAVFCFGALWFWDSTDPLPLTATQSSLPAKASSVGVTAPARVATSGSAKHASVFK